jgi:hypothetical protein
VNQLSSKRDPRSFALLLVEASSLLTQAANYLNGMIDKDNSDNLVVIRASLKGLSLQISNLSKSGCNMIELQKIINRADKLMNQIPPIPRVMQNAILAKENLIKAMAYC